MIPALGAGPVVHSTEYGSGSFKIYYSAEMINHDG
jgi:hypothetical protein